MTLLSIVEVRYVVAMVKRKIGIVTTFITMMLDLVSQIWFMVLYVVKFYFAYYYYWDDWSRSCWPCIGNHFALSSSTATIFLPATFKATLTATQQEECKHHCHRNLRAGPLQSWTVSSQLLYSSKMSNQFHPPNHLPLLLLDTLPIINLSLLLVICEIR